MKTNLSIRPLAGSIVCSAAMITIVCAVTLQADVTVYQPTGVAVTSQMLLVSTPSCNPGSLLSPPLNLPRQILSFSLAGGPGTVFSDLSSLPGANIMCNTQGTSQFESYLAVSPGLGGFPAGEVYVLLNNKVYQIPPSGGAPTLFATLPHQTHGIVFDQVGNLGYNLIVTAHYSTSANNFVSAIYQITSAGVVSQIGPNFKNALFEGPAIATANFGTISAGDIVVADQGGARILDINPSGTPSVFATGFISPEGVDFIPQQFCTFYDAIFGPLSNEEANQLNPNPSIVKTYEPGFFAGHNGQMLVRDQLNPNQPPNAGTNIYAVDSTGHATILGTAPGQQEGAAFAPACPPPPCTSINSSNFNGTPIPGGDYIWFNANFTVSGLNKQTTTTIQFGSSTIQFSAGGQNYTVAVPNALISFSPSANCASTSFNTNLGQWETIVPTSGSDEIFLSGVAFQVPAGGLPGGINPVTWQGSFQSSASGLGIQWKWGAAVYTTFSTDYNAMGVKPTHSNSCSYNNSDHAGTPENFTKFVVGGARGGGGANTTGSWSGTVSVNCLP